MLGRHNSITICLCLKGKINHLANYQLDSHGVDFCAEHSSCAASIGLRVNDVKQALNTAVAKEAAPCGQADRVIFEEVQG